MREQAIQILLEIAQGTAQKQGEKTVYPTIRERLAAIKLLATMEGWNRPQKKTVENLNKDQYSSCRERADFFCF